MKIVCESCQAKYSIADDKVAGKMFKIRCKRCGEVIIVRGDQPPQEQQPGPEAPVAAADAVWHIVIDGEQFGPYAPEQIGEFLATGRIDWEAYVWREGFDNWVPACDVSELVDSIMGPASQGQAEAGAQPAAAAAGYTADAGADGVGAAAAMASPVPASAPLGPASMGADPFAEEGSSGGALFGEPAAGVGAGADLFGPGVEASPFDAGGAGGGADGVVASAASPQLDGAQAMTGARNENSVLFSLKNLQALATGTSGGGPVTSGAPMAAQPAPGYAGGEGSGLIDIRSLATAAGIASAEAQDADREELLSMGSKTGAFGALGSPMAPVVAEGSERNRTVYAILGGAAFLAVAMVIVAFILRPGPEAQMPAAAVVAPGAAAQPAEEQASAQAPGAASDTIKTELSEGEKAALAAAKEAAAASQQGSGRTKPRAARRSTGSRRESSAGSTTRQASPAPAAAPQEQPAKRVSSASASIDDLLAGALGGSAKKKTTTRSSAPSAAPKSSLPPRPSREQVKSALRGVQSAVSACAKGKGGVAIADIVVANSGRVKSVRVSQAQGPVASCIARAVRRARFPKFSESSFSVKFPFRL